MYDKRCPRTRVWSSWRSRTARVRLLAPPPVQPAAMAWSVSTVTTVHRHTPSYTASIQQQRRVLASAFPPPRYGMTAKAPPAGHVKGIGFRSSRGDAAGNAGETAAGVPAALSG